MKALGKFSNVTIAALFVVAALAVAFWMLALSPKREEAARLGKEVETAEASLSQHRAEVVEAEEARREFPKDYQKLVVLGKAVPGDDETASLLIQVSGIAHRAGVTFNDLSLGAGGGGEEATPAAPTAEAGAPVSPTEAAASLLPLGAAVGPAGLAVMPYSLTFSGGFFEIADFIEGLDAMVKTHNEEVTVDGRLLTIDSFSLSAGGTGEAGEAAGEGKGGRGELTASFSITTYVTPPSEGVTGGSTPESPAGLEATPAAATLGGAP